MSTEDLIYIFNSNYTSEVDSFLIGLIKMAVEERVLLINKEIFVNKNIYEQKINQINSQRHKFDFGGGPQEIGHFALKLLAKDYLQNKQKTAKFEKEFAGRFIDVCSDDYNIIIECGNTDPEKIFDYFSEPKVKEIIILPYPVIDFKNLFLFKFTKGKNISKFIAAIHQTRSSSIKSALKKSKLYQHL